MLFGNQRAGGMLPTSHLAALGVQEPPDHLRSRETGLGGTLGTQAEGGGCSSMEAPGPSAHQRVLCLGGQEKMWDFSRCHVEGAGHRGQRASPAPEITTSESASW